MQRGTHTSTLQSCGHIPCKSDLSMLSTISQTLPPNLQVAAASEPEQLSHNRPVFSNPCKGLLSDRHPWEPQPSLWGQSLQPVGTKHSSVKCRLDRVCAILHGPEDKSPLTLMRSRGPGLDISLLQGEGAQTPP